jgi:NADPH-dependent glutamate synthase beta subunit-like oxidoreductase
MPPRFSREVSSPIVHGSVLDLQGRTSPCEAGCPAGNPIQKVHALVREERLPEAVEYLRSRNPFPGVTGRVCSHPCETQCNRSGYDEPVAIRALERYAADHVDMTRVRSPLRSEASGKRVAVIGSGPAGLTCAYFSALFGHEVTVFEGSSVLGGMPRRGIPDFRLPKYVVDREVGLILELGVRARTNTLVGRDIDLDELMQEYDACLIATGTWKEKVPVVPDLGGSLGGLSFLTRVNRGDPPRLGERVVIVGGGGVGFDCAFTARRLGVSEVHVVCVEDRGTMRVTSEDVDQARREQIVVHPGHMISRMLRSAGETAGVECFPISSFHLDEGGRMSVVPASGGTIRIHADTVILAVGLEPDPAFTRNRFERTDKGTLQVNGANMSTSVPGVFAAGDVVHGPGTVARAVGSGRVAAIAIHRYLSAGRPDLRVRVTGGGGKILEFEECPEEPGPHVVAYEELLDKESFEKCQRERTARLEPDRSIRCFEEMDLGFRHAEQAVREAGRCFRCGHCRVCGKCAEHCPGYVLAMEEDGPVVSFPDECWHCGSCRIHCPSSCISYEFPISMLV